MKLHENKLLFRQAIQYTSDRMEMAAVYVEKDYWVTFALQTIFNAPVGEDTVCKGGTALSKCYKMIDRFSEDIDLVVLRREGDSNNRLTNKIRSIGSVVDAVLPEIDIEGLTRKMGMNRKTAHAYAREFEGNYGQIRDVIVVEATWLGYYEPFTTRRINSFVGEMMANSNQEKIAEEYEMQPFDVRVLEPIRTICEKIMSLVRFSYGEDPVDDLRKKIRHTYDLHQLLQQEEFAGFLKSPAFDEMLLKVANDDVLSFRNNNRWLRHHPNEALIFREIDNVWRDLESVYRGEFRNLVYGSFPDDKLVLATLKEIKERLSAVEWTIEIENNG